MSSTPTPAPAAAPTAPTAPAATPATPAPTAPPTAAPTPAPAAAPAPTNPAPATPATLTAPAPQKSWIARNGVKLAVGGVGCIVLATLMALVAIFLLTLGIWIGTGFWPMHWSWGQPTPTPIVAPAPSPTPAPIVAPAPAPTTLEQTVQVILVMVNDLGDAIAELTLRVEALEAGGSNASPRPSVPTDRVKVAGTVQELGRAWTIVDGRRWHIIDATAHDGTTYPRSCFSGSPVVPGKRLPAAGGCPEREASYK